MGQLTFTQSVLLAGALSAVCLGLLLIIAGTLLADRPDDEMATPVSRERSGGLDATVDDLLGWDVVHEGRAMRAARLAADEHIDRRISRSPLAGSIGSREHRTPPVADRPLIRPPGPVTREFAAITGHDLRDACGPDEHTIRPAKAGARGVQVAMGWVTR